MSQAVPPPTTPPRFPWFRRFGLPVVVILFIAGAIAAVWCAPVPPDNFPRGLIIFSLLMLGGLLMSTWLLFFSGLQLWLKLLVLVLGCYLVYDCADWTNINFDGSAQKFLVVWRVPIAHRFLPTLDDLLEASRKDHAASGAVALEGDGKADFPGYLGASRSSVVAGPAIRTEWPTPPKPVWKQPAGGGFAGLAVVGGFAVTIEQRRDNEVVVGYDAATGKERWTYSWPTRFRERMGGDGPRATPTIFEGDVFALGANGHLVCLAADSGKVKWSQEILEGNRNIQWAMSGSPLVFDDVVVVNPGGQGKQGYALVAYDRKTGELKWHAGDSHAGYSSPMLVTLGGKQQILLLDGDQLGGYDAKTGTPLWSFPWDKTMQKINVAQPVVLDGDRVFISSGYSIGGAMLAIKEKDGKWSAEPLWRTTKLKCKFSSPIVHKGHLYGLDEGVLVCLDAADGQEKWRGERYKHGQVLLTGDVLVVMSEGGELAFVDAVPEAFRERGRFRALDDENKNWNPHALANGKVYVRNHEQMACYDLNKP